MENASRTWRVIRRLPSWRALDTIGNSGLAKSTILVPIIGYLILFNEQIVEYLYLSENFVWSNLGENRVQNHNLRLFFMYFGLSFIGIGSLLFQIFCPRPIKGNKGMGHYVENEKNMGSPARHKHLREIIGEEYNRLYATSKLMSPYMHRMICFLSDFDEKTKGFVHSDELHPGVDGRKISKHDIYGVSISDDEVDSETLKSHFFLANIRYAKLRLVITILYGIGFAMLSIPTADTFIRVCISMWRQVSI